MFRDPACSTFRKTLIASVLGVGVFLIPNAVQSATSNSATLQWAANQESDLAGYRVYHGTAPGNYGSSQTIGKTTSYQYANLEFNKTHYFSVTAYDTSGNESPPSAEVSKAMAAQNSVLSISMNGEGTVTSSPAGLSCSNGACSGTFAQGASVTLTAVPSTGMAFSGWAGACAGAGSCGLTLSASSTSVSAKFAVILDDSLAEPEEGLDIDPSIPPIDQSNWTLAYVDSEALGGGGYAATQAFDGLSTTIWHTEWQGSSPAHNHDLMVDLGAVYSIAGFRELPRQDGGVNGRIGEYEFYVKTDSGTAPTTPPAMGEWTKVAAGIFPNTEVEQAVFFATRDSRYVWLRAVDEAQGVGSPWTSLAELNVLGTLPSEKPISVSPTIDQSGWTLAYVDSEALGGGGYAATQAFDGLSTTIWHTEWQGPSPAHDHDLMVDLGAVYSITGFRELPRQDGGVNGRIGKFEFYVKTDSGTAPTTPPVVGEWTKLAAGTFPNTEVEQAVFFAMRDSRYVWLRAVDEAQGVGSPWTSLAELNVLGTLLAEPNDPSGNEGSSGPEVSNPDIGSDSVISISVSGEGTVTSSPAGLSCSNGACSGTFAQGSSVTLTAVPSSGRTFSGWAGACEGSGSCGLTLSASSTSASALFSAKAIDQSGWTLEYVDSEALGGGGYAATQAFDGLSTTIWHSEWQGTSPAHNHDLMVDLGEVYSIAGFRELPRQDGGVNGRIGKFEFYVKTDSGTAPTTPPVVGEWTKLATGTFPDTEVEQEVFFATRDSRYVWLRAVDEAQGVGNPWTSLAELNVLGALPK